MKALRYFSTNENKNLCNEVVWFVPFGEFLVLGTQGETVKLNFKMFKIVLWLYYCLVYSIIKCMLWEEPLRNVVVQDETVSACSALVTPAYLNRVAKSFAGTPTVVTQMVPPVFPSKNDALHDDGTCVHIARCPSLCHQEGRRYRRTRANHTWEFTPPVVVFLGW